MRLTIFEQFTSLEERKKEQLIQAIREVVTKVERVAFLLVVHTLPDNATLFSAVLDEVSLCEKEMFCRWLRHCYYCFIIRGKSTRTRAVFSTIYSANTFVKK